MNTFNRVIIIAFLLAGMLGSAVILFLLTNSPSAFINSLQNTLRTVDEIMSNTSYPNRVSFAFGLGGIIWLFLGFFLWLEISPSARNTIQVASLTKDMVEIEIDSIAQRLIHNLKRLSDVYAVEPLVQAKRNEVQIALTLIVDPVVNIPMKTGEIQALTHEIIEDQMGLRAGSIKVTLAHGSVSPEAE